MGLRFKVNGTRIEPPSIEDYSPPRLKSISRDKICETMKSIEIPKGGTVLMFPGDDKEVMENRKHFLRLSASKGVRAHLLGGKIKPAHEIDKHTIDQVTAFSSTNGGRVYLFYLAKAKIVS